MLTAVAGVVIVMEFSLLALLVELREEASEEALLPLLLLLLLLLLEDELELEDELLDVEEEERRRPRRRDNSELLEEEERDLRLRERDVAEGRRRLDDEADRERRRLGPLRLRVRRPEVVAAYPRPPPRLSTDLRGLDRSLDLSRRLAAYPPPPPPRLSLSRSRSLGLGG